MSTTKFKRETWTVINKLQTILENRTEPYPTLGHFYREIELLKFPWLGTLTEKSSYYSKHGRNVYSQQQYDSIMSHCIIKGWIKVTSFNRHYKVFPTATAAKKTHNTSPSIKSQTVKASPVMASTDYEKQIPADELMLNIKLDPSIQWTIRTINGVAHLSTKTYC